jgi:hydroxymethylbilane synthase
VIAALGADCHSAVGVYAQVSGDELAVRAQVLAWDGSDSVQGEISGPLFSAGQLGEELGLTLLEKGGKALLSRPYPI